MLYGNPAKQTRDSYKINEPEHKPNLDAERFRIYNNNGEIRETHDGVQRVFLRGRMYPGLKTSRSIGDLIPHQIGVTSEPDFYSQHVSSNDKFLMLGSAALFDQLGVNEILEKVGDAAGSREKQKDIMNKITTQYRDSIIT